jgi:hypothetical protein
MTFLGESRRLVAGIAAAGLLTVALAGGISAQTIDTSGVGNGGDSNANSDGGSINMGPIGSGGSSGAEIGTGTPLRG